MKKFLIIQTAFLGDAVLVTSIVEKLHSFYPDAAIDLVVRKGNDGLFTGHPFLRTLHVWDKRQGKTSALFKLIGTFRSQRYDHVINAQRFFSTGLMTALSGGKETFGYDKNPLSFLFSRKVKHLIPDPAELRSHPVKSDARIIHEVDRLNDLIAHLTDHNRPLPRLYPSVSDHKKVNGLIERWTKDHRSYITVAPASVWFTKQWPEAKWIELVKAIPNEQQVFIIGAPSDTDLAQRIIAATGRGVDLTRELKLLESAALMKSATMNYVNDSAPLHIASAMNAPVTAVFCSTVPAFGFGPLRENGRAVGSNELLDCRPCGLHGYKSCPKGHFKCALAIDSQRVIGS
ncbi:MAG: glycosyltransferase family 9 protein [Flavobacteriales bacterium]|nr:glycosyltransferase family 9 protein [Flavobacteriales bacterium]